MGDTNKTESFIQRWPKASGSERANCQLFVTELCALVDLPQPDLASEDNRGKTCVFGRRVMLAHGGGSQTLGFIDCCRRGNFVLEARKIKADANRRQCA